MAATYIRGSKSREREPENFVVAIFKRYAFKHSFRTKFIFKPSTVAAFCCRPTGLTTFVALAARRMRPRENTTAVLAEILHRSADTDDSYLRLERELRTHLKVTKCEQELNWRQSDTFANWLNLEVSACDFSIRQY